MVEHVFELVLAAGVPSVRREARLRPQIAHIIERATKAERDEVVLLIVAQAPISVAPSRSCARFTALVYSRGGRTPSVHPGMQMVRSIVSCVTSGLSAPGVRDGSGRELCPHAGPVNNAASAMVIAARVTVNGPDGASGRMGRHGEGRDRTCISQCSPSFISHHSAQCRGAERECTHAGFEKRVLQNGKILLGKR